MSIKQIKPAKRTRQISLLFCLAIVLTLGVGLGWSVWKAKQQRRAVVAIEALGGKVFYDYETEGVGVIIDDAEAPGPEWVRDLLGVDFVSDVTVVRLNYVQVSDLTMLTDLTNLRRLFLYRSQVTDLSPLAELQNLRMLHFDHSPVSDLTPLAGLPKLSGLNLSYTQVRDLTPLAGVNSLQVLNLTGTPVNDVSPLAGLENLEILNLSRTHVTDVDALARMKYLTILLPEEYDVSE